MRVVVVGGYGVFGSRRAELLGRDGNAVWLTGRAPEKARLAAKRLGASTLVLDRDGDLAPILAAAPRVVVDAAGPFQSYGRDRYRLPRFCIDHGIDYLDLSDDAGFDARSVLLRGGIELGLLNVGLSALACLYRLGLAAMTERLVAPARWLAGLLEPFGTDTGGMVVEVTGPRDGQPVCRRWRLTAEAGEGPFVPAVAARALLRRFDRIATGARPCLAEATLAEMEAAMADLAIRTELSEEPRPTLMQAALRDRWTELPPSVRRMHSVQDVQSFSGRASVERGTGLIAQFAAWCFGFPEEGEDVALTAIKTRTPRGEIWQRDFAGRAFRSFLTPSSHPYRYRERFWAFDYEQDLSVGDGALHLQVRRGWFLGVPIPRRLLPGSDSREREVDGVFRIDVGLSAPLGGGLVVRYRGSVAPDELGEASPPPEAETAETSTGRRPAPAA